MSLDLAEVDPSRRAAVALDEARSSSDRWTKANRRPRGLTAREALAAAHFECLVLYTAWAYVLNGEVLTDADNERIRVAMARILALFEEAY